MNIKKGDQVKILIGKDRGKTGRVLKSLPEEEMIIIEGLNLYQKKSRPKRQGQKGEIVSLPRPIHASNAMIICGNCKKATRVSFAGGGKKTRYCKKCKLEI